MKRPTFARLTSSFRRGKRIDSGTEFRGGISVSASTPAGKAAPTRRRPSRAGRVPAPSWHDLVQPGPKGSPKRKAERLERAAAQHGEFRQVTSKPNRARRDQTPNGAPRRDVRVYSRAIGLQDAGRLVLHKHRPARRAGVALASPTSSRGRAQRTGLDHQTPAAPDPARPVTRRAQAATPAAQQVKPRK